MASLKVCPVEGQSIDLAGATIVLVRLKAACLLCECVV